MNKIKHVLGPTLIHNKILNILSYHWSCLPTDFSSLRKEKQVKRQRGNIGKDRKQDRNPYKRN